MAEVTTTHTASAEDLTLNAMGYKFIGTPMPVLEDRRFVRGRGRYIADLELPDMLHLGVCSSPVAHARITSIDVEEARKAPGVIAVLTGADVVERMECIPQELHLPEVKWYPLAIDKIRYVGEWTAAIVATSRAAAEDAAELVVIEFEELAPLVDPEQAKLPGAALLHEAHGSNVVWEDNFDFGDVESALKKADHIFEYRYRWNRHSGVPLETFGVVAHYDTQYEQIDIWASHQNPGLQQEAIEVLRSRARVHVDVDVGGSYGSKRGQKHMYLTAVAAMMTGKPVKFIEDRTENMQAGDGHGPDRIYNIKLAVSSEGIVEGADVEIIEDLGAYSGRGPRPILKPTTALCGPYHIKEMRYHGFGVLTCKTNQVPFRGAGQSPYNYVLERSMDHIAEALNIDRAELRRRNFIQPEEFPYKTPGGSVYDSGDYPGALAMALKEANYEQLLEEQAEGRKVGRLIGIGLAGAIEPGGGGGETTEGARIEVDRKGRVTATIGFQSAGQAHESMVTQIVCEELGVMPADVMVRRGDGQSGIIGGATTGSRMHFRVGLALKSASDKVNDKLMAIAAHQFEAPIEDMVRYQGTFHVAGNPASTMTLKELALKAYGPREERPEDMETGIVEDSVVLGPKLPKMPRNSAQAFPSYAFDFHIPVVEIDPETFDIKFLRYVVVHDCGTQMNPLVVDGFVYGGIGHGIGGALYEKFSYNASGQLESASFMDYLIPTATEIPHVDLHTMVTPAPLHPYGAKGTGEGAYMTAPAAVASAVEDALRPHGISLDQIPISPQLLYDLVKASKKDAEI